MKLHHSNIEFTVPDEFTTAPQPQGPDPRVAMLNPCQRRAFDSVMDFLGGRLAANALLIEGFAGTGKSFLVNTLVAELDRLNPEMKIAFAAPTHAALNVLRKGGRYNHKGTDDSRAQAQRRAMQRVSFFTTVQLLGLKYTVNEQGVESYESPAMQDPDDVPVSQVTVAIIDETSMIPADIVARCLEWAGAVYIVFLGDGAQLSPVKEGPTPILASEGYREANGVVRLVLDQPMRQAEGSSILDLATAVREGRFFGDFSPFLKQGEMDRLTDMRHFKAMLHEGLNPNSGGWHGDPASFRVLAYTNDAVKSANALCRAFWHGQAGPDGRVPLMAADLPPVMAGESMLTTAPLVGPGGEVLINNGKELRCKATMPSTLTLPAFNPSHGPVTLPVLRCLVADAPFDGEEPEEMEVTVLDTSIPGLDTEKRFDAWRIASMAFLRNERKPQLWKEFFAQDRQVLRWQHVFASTVHKAQGTTLATAMPLWGDFQRMRTTDPMNYNRLLYTGVTRAKERIVIAP